MKNYREYYRQMGNLMYCVACVDGRIAPQEWATLRRLVREELVPAEKHYDEFGTDSAFAVEFQFDVLEGNAGGFTEAWDDLATYLKQNAALLPESDKTRMLDAAGKVAAAFHGISKSENRLLEQLKTLLNS